MIMPDDRNGKAAAFGAPLEKQMLWLGDRLILGDLVFRLQHFKTGRLHRIYLDCRSFLF